MNAPMINTPRRILVASFTAFALAIVLLILFILPAEYGIDPSGVGKALGLTDLSEKKSTAIVAQKFPFHMDSAEFVLSPFESVEYKYRIEENGILLYSWQASAEVLYDFHAEPDGTDPEFAESFDQQRRTSSNGSYTAPFPGIHGWYWENRGSSDVIITLSTAGFYSKAIEFRDGLVAEKATMPVTRAQESKPFVE